MNELQRSEKKEIESALLRCGTQAEAARALGIKRTTMLSKMKKLGICADTPALADDVCNTIAIPPGGRVFIEILKRASDVAMRIRIE